MNLAGILGKAQNVFSTVKSKGGELKNLVDGFKKNSSDDLSESLPMVKRSTDVTTSVDDNQEKKPNYMLIGIIAIVAIFLIMKKK